MCVSYTVRWVGICHMCNHMFEFNMQCVDVCVCQESTFVVIDICSKV